MKTKKLGRGAKISLPLLFLLLAALLVAALSGVFGAPGGESAGEASSDAAVSEALPAAADPEGVLILWAIDVGQGDGLLLRMPTGEHVLVDSGVNTDKNAVPDFLRERAWRRSNTPCSPTRTPTISARRRRWCAASA